MKLKINKASDLDSISVLPRHLRRSSIGPTRPQAPQHRSQTPQPSYSQGQSFSQGLSSQHGIFSQLTTQNSLEEAVTNDQRFGSQERENSLKKVSCCPPANYTREGSQMSMPRSSSNPIRKWNSASVSDHKSQYSEELEHRTGMIETSLNRFGMILDSVQSDVMQVSKGTKEILMENMDKHLVASSEIIRHKLALHDTSLQLMNKQQADIKASLDETIKSISDLLKRDTYQEKLQSISLVLSTLPGQMETSLRKLKFDLLSTLTREMQAMSNMKSTKITNQKDPAANILPVKVTGCSTTSVTRRQPQQPRNPVKASFNSVKRILSPKTEMGCWKSVKPACKKRALPKFETVSPIEQERTGRVLIESDEDMDVGFSCLLDEKKRGNSFIDEANYETERILRAARRSKRMSCNPIIID